MSSTDIFVPGQWFKGRIYERRADLSSGGRLLLYFAAKFKGPYYSWTAVSGPPYLTALALWPKSDMRTRGVAERSGPWYATEHTVVGVQNQVEVLLGRTDWADWDRSGDLLFAKDGALFRLGFDESGNLRSPDAARRLIDTSGFAFSEKPPRPKQGNGRRLNGPDESPG